MQSNPVIIQKAVFHAALWHDTGPDALNPKLQLRKNNGMPYIFHPMAVASIISEYTNDSNVVAAGVLHDVLEDTFITKDDLSLHFNETISQLVSEVTNLENNEATREERGNRYIQKVSQISPDGQLIKAADCLHNLSDLFSAPEKWAFRYTGEKMKLLSVLENAPEELIKRCKDKIFGFRRTIIGIKPS